jgi:hypothetical protein
MKARVVGHFWKTFKLGASAAVPILILVLLGKFVAGFFASAVDAVPLRPWVTILIAAGAIYLIGLISRKTSFASYLKEKFPFPLVHWVVGMVFPSEEDEQGEVLFYPIAGNREIRIRGVVKGESPDGKCYVVHFACPPTPMTGFTLFEIAKESKSLEFTGRGALTYHLYTATFGKK